KERTRLPHPGEVIRVAVTSNDRSLLTTCLDGVVRIWDLATGKEARRLNGSHGAWCLSLSPDGQSVVTETRDQPMDTSLVSDFATGKELRRLPLGGQSLFTPGGKQLFGVFQQSLVEAQNGRLVRSFNGHRDWVRDGAISPDGRLGVTVSGAMGKPE